MAVKSVLKFKFWINLEQAITILFFFLNGALDRLYRSSVGGAKSLYLSNCWLKLVIQRFAQARDYMRYYNLSVVFSMLCASLRFLVSFPSEVKSLSETFVICVPKIMPFLLKLKTYTYIYLYMNNIIIYICHNISIIRKLYAI